MDFDHHLQNPDVFIGLMSNYEISSVTSNAIPIPFSSQGDAPGRFSSGLGQSSCRVFKGETPKSEIAQWAIHADRNSRVGHLQCNHIA
jgi:hypothetical protein